MHDAALFLSEAREHMSQIFRSIPADIAQEVASNEVEQRTQQTEDASAAESESTDESDQDFLRAANSATIPAGSAEPVDGNFASQMAAHGATTPAITVMQHCVHGTRYCKSVSRFLALSTSTSLSLPFPR